MELIIGLVIAAGDFIAAFAMSSYSYFQEKLNNN